jgi:hypothetical protein
LPTSVHAELDDLHVEIRRTDTKISRLYLAGRIAEAGQYSSRYVIRPCSKQRAHCRLIAFIANAEVRRTGQAGLAERTGMSAVGGWFPVPAPHYTQVAKKLAIHF